MSGGQRGKRRGRARVAPRVNASRKLTPCGVPRYPRGSVFRSRRHLVVKLPVPCDQARLFVIGIRPGGVHHSSRNPRPRDTAHAPTSPWIVSPIRPLPSATGPTSGGRPEKVVTPPSETRPDENRASTRRGGGHNCPSVAYGRCPLMRRPRLRRRAFVVRPRRRAPVLPSRCSRCR